MHEVKAQLEEIQGFIRQGLKKVDLPAKRKELEKLNSEISSEGFWNDKRNAAEVSQRAANLNRLIETWEGIKSECDELTSLLPEIHPEKDPKAAEDFKGMVAKLAERWRVLQISTFLGGK